MFYRIDTNSKFRIRISCEEVIGELEVYDPIEYRDSRKLLNTYPSHDHVEVYQAMELAFPEVEYCQLQIRSRSGRLPKMPDIWTYEEFCIVSEKCRAIIESVDDFPHQYFPLILIDKNGEQLGGQYYWLHVRRIVEVEPSKLPALKTNFHMGSVYEADMARLQHDPTARACVEALPLWRYVLDGHAICVNETMMAALREADITGLKESKDELDREGDVGNV
ncbi:imm11 family protein [Vibrio hepatarius]|uniref:imm11 family protein n=1 Tax=Vibrio hepatarius TaxID=171383 RepID=UPI00148DF8E8|nr:DUF1629 domain-containing protein [Vibrio hepatarius]NOI15182.1 hypothetical protein [Vibrio hepatarius]